MKRRSLLPMSGPFGGPFDMLLGCHQRIRFFSALAERIATQPAPANEVAEAASRLRLYFGTALPLHEQDEEETLHQALVEARAPGIDALFARMRKEHRAIEAMLDELSPTWELLKTEPERLELERDALARGGAALVAAFEPHLAMEEDELFPLARAVLAPEVLAAMFRAMRARRDAVAAELTSLHVGPLPPPRTVHGS